MSALLAAVPRWFYAAIAIVAWPSGWVAADEVGDAVIQPATAEAFVTPGDNVPTRTVRFEQRETAVGDRVVQRLGSQFRVTTRIIQSGQVAHEGTNVIRSQQQRTIDALAVAEGRAVMSRASFQLSRRQQPDAADPEALTPTAVEGKSYLLARNDDQQLEVTDLEGAIPPLEEFKVVAESLDGVGKPNPLALVLAGREVAVGQRLFVPHDMAKALFGLAAPELDMVHRFELTLDRLQPPTAGGADAAVFKVTLEVKPQGADATSVLLAGEMAVEPATCRLASVDLAGPVHVVALEQTRMGEYEYSMDGELQLAIRSEFGRAP